MEHRADIDNCLQNTNQQVISFLRRAKQASQMAKHQLSCSHKYNTSLTWGLIGFNNDIFDKVYIFL